MSSSVDRAAEISEALAEIRSQAQVATSGSFPPTLVAVSKYKPASDVSACYADGQLDFGENYVQELVEKAEALPAEIRWHFIGTLQSNKAKILALIPNLHMIQTLTSIKTAKALDKALPTDRSAPLNVLVQINTSGEEAKSGLPALTSSTDVAASELFQLAKTIIAECPRLRLQGVMTIGSLEQSLSASETHKNLDFDRLKETRDVLQDYLKTQLGEQSQVKWGQDGRLVLSMGMSSDFEAALKAGSDIVRVGTGIFGERAKKTAA